MGFVSLTLTSESSGSIGHSLGFLPLSESTLHYNAKVSYLHGHFFHTPQPSSRSFRPHLYASLVSEID